MTDTYKGYTLRHYPKTPAHPAHDGRYQTFKPRPYDDAEYWWAYSYDGAHWRVVFEGKVEHELTATFEEVVDFIEARNAEVKQKIARW